MTVMLRPQNVWILLDPSSANVWKDMRKLTPINHAMVSNDAFLISQRELACGFSAEIRRTSDLKSQHLAYKHNMFII